MKKRERENPCFICGHYHDYEKGEVCGICGHRLIEPTEKGPSLSALSTEILPSFLYLGSYDNASRSELLRAQGIKKILNTVPGCQNMYTTSFTYHTISNDKEMPFEECLQFIEASRLEGSKVLVHCMTGQSRSPAVVVAYLMRHKQWSLEESIRWVTERRQGVNIAQDLLQQLQAFQSVAHSAPTAITPPTFPPIPFPTPGASSSSSSTFSLAHTSAAGAALFPPPLVPPMATALFPASSPAPPASEQQRGIHGAPFVFSTATTPQSNEPARQNGFVFGGPTGLGSSFDGAEIVSFGSAAPPAAGPSQSFDQDAEMGGQPPS